VSLQIAGYLMSPETPRINAVAAIKVGIQKREFA